MNNMNSMNEASNCNEKGASAGSCKQGCPASGEDINAKSCTATVLNELYKNVDMSKESLLDVLPKIKNSEFSSEITSQLEEYSRFEKKLVPLIKAECADPKPQGVVSKMSAKLGIEMKTMMDPADERIAKMVIEGTTMGITDTIRLVRDYENSNCSEEALSLARELVSFQEKCVERTKKFLG